MLDLAKIDELLSERQSTYRREMKVAVGYGALMVFLAIFGRWPLLQVATGILAVVRAIAFFLIWRHQKPLHELTRLSCGDKAISLARFLESDILFLTQSTFWYALPLGLGMVMIGLAIWQHTHSPWVSGVCFLLGIGVALGGYRMNAKKAEEMNIICRQLSG